MSNFATVARTAYRKADPQGLVEFDYWTTEMFAGCQITVELANGSKVTGPLVVVTNEGFGGFRVMVRTDQGLRTGLIETSWI